MLLLIFHHKGPFNFFGEKWNKKIGGRSFVITCGAFEDTLLNMHKVNSLVFKTGGVASPLWVRDDKVKSSAVLNISQEVSVHNKCEQQYPRKKMGNLIKLL